MITKKDIEILKDTFATKIELQEMKSELKNDIATFKDEIMFQILAMRDELSVVIGYRNNIEDHEIRIEKLEDQVLANSN